MTAKRHSPTSPPWSTTTKALVALVTITLLALLFWRFTSLLQPLVIAAILAYLLNPLISLLTARSRLGRGGATVIVYLVLLFLLMGCITALGLVTVDQAGKLAGFLPGSVDETVAVLGQQVDAINRQGWNFFGVTLQLPPDLLTEQLTNLRNQLLPQLRPIVTNTGSVVVGVASTTFSYLSDFFLIFLVSIYMAKDSPHLWPGLQELADQPGYRADAARLLDEFSRIWATYLRGQVILAVIMAVASGVVLTAIGLNYSLALALLIGLAEFLPLIGPAIALAAAVLVALFQPDNWLGLSPLAYGGLVIALIFVLQQIQGTFLTPRIVGNALALHPIAILVGVIMASGLAGILGAVLAAPLLATIKLVGGYIWRKLVDLPPFADEVALDAGNPLPVSAAMTAALPVAPAEISAKAAIEAISAPPDHQE
jgi:predicted PurR-regulated permease PerM